MQLPRAAAISPFLLPIRRYFVVMFFEKLKELFFRLCAEAEPMGVLAQKRWGVLRLLLTRAEDMHSRESPKWARLKMGDAVDNEVYWYSPNSGFTCALLSFVRALFGYKHVTLRQLCDLSRVTLEEWYSGDTRRTVSFCEKVDEESGYSPVLDKVVITDEESGYSPVLDKVVITLRERERPYLIQLAKKLTTGLQGFLWQFDSRYSSKREAHDVDFYAFILPLLQLGDQIGMEYWEHPDPLLEQLRRRPDPEYREAPLPGRVYSRHRRPFVLHLAFADEWYVEHIHSLFELDFVDLRCLNYTDPKNSESALPWDLNPFAWVLSDKNEFGVDPPQPSSVRAKGLGWVVYALRASPVLTSLLDVKTLLFLLDIINAEKKRHVHFSGAPDLSAIPGAWKLDTEAGRLDVVDELKGRCGQHSTKRAEME